MAEALRREDLPHLQLLEVLGHGGGGVVFRGKLHALEVAIKVFEVPGDLATAAGGSRRGSGVVGWRSVLVLRWGWRKGFRPRSGACCRLSWGSRPLLQLVPC